jgi:hypothetical protein
MRRNLGLEPMFTYLGGKWRLAPKYPPPIHDTIIEPFCGSAGYSLRSDIGNIVFLQRRLASVSTSLLRIKDKKRKRKKGFSHCDYITGKMKNVSFVFCWDEFFLLVLSFPGPYNSR